MPAPDTALSEILVDAPNWTWLSFGVGFDSATKKERRNQGCSRNPRQGAQKAAQGPTPPCGGVVPSDCLSAFKSQRSGPGWRFF